MIFIYFIDIQIYNTNLGKKTEPISIKCERLGPVFKIWLMCRTFEMSATYLRELNGYEGVRS